MRARVPVQLPAGPAAIAIVFGGEGAKTPKAPPILAAAARDAPSGGAPEPLVEARLGVLTQREVHLAINLL